MLEIYKICVKNVTLTSCISHYNVNTQRSYTNYTRVYYNELMKASRTYQDFTQKRFCKYIGTNVYLIH